MWGVGALHTTARDLVAMEIGARALSLTLALTLTLSVPFSLSLSHVSRVCVCVRMHACMQAMTRFASLQCDH